MLICGDGARQSYEAIKNAWVSQCCEAGSVAFGAEPLAVNFYDGWPELLEVSVCQ